MNFSKKLKKVPTHIWILTVIILVGIFLRTYNFHSWLKFRDDQARDATLVSQVVQGEKPWPMMGAYMSYSGDGDHLETNSFHLGPIYYYFQIISSKVFGNYADKLAYPDVLFGVLAIPLLYLFLRIYFRRETSLGVAGLFAISSYFVQYSRFAWNTNLIPFFVLLFLFSLHKLLEKNEQAKWRWASLLGISVGVGVQLHVIIMVLFLVVAFFVMLFSLKKSFKAWPQWMLVFLLVCVLNTTQIISELKSNFSNTKILLSSSSRDNGPGISKFTLIKNDLDCHVEANAYYLSSYGSSNCIYDFLNPVAYAEVRTKNSSKFFQDVFSRLVMLLAVVFSFFGYFLLFKKAKNEKGKSQQYFLRLIVFYCAIDFLLMISLSMDKFNDLRYLTPVFFVPFVLLALLVEFIQEKFSKQQARGLLTLLVLLLIFTNGVAIADQALPLVAKDRTCSSHSTTIGELEPVAQYLMANSGGRQPIYFGGDKTFRVVYMPLAYVLKKHGVTSEEIPAEPQLSENKEGPTYMVSCKAGAQNYYPYAEVNSIFVYKLNK